MTECITLETELTHPSPAKEVFPLLDPLREYEWLAGWRCETYWERPEVGQCFSTELPNQGAERWILAAQEHNHRLVFVRAGEHHLLLQEIELIPNAKGCISRWRKRWIATSVEGRAQLQRLRSEEAFSGELAALHSLGEALNHYLATGECLSPATPTEEIMAHIGELTKRFGISRGTLLHYHQLGLLSPHGRTASQYRVYGDAEIARLERILAYRQTGLSLEEIRRLLDAPSDEGSQILAERLTAMDGEIRQLREQQALIVGLLRNDAFAERIGAMTKATWVALLSAAGFTEPDMERWHRDFERTAPEKHQRFLEYLCIPKDEIEQIRAFSRSPLDKTLWVTLLREAGLDDQGLMRWHTAFERQAPVAHQRLLERLGLPAEEVAAIRAQSGRAESALSEPTLDKALWVALLHEAGVDDQGLKRWHTAFERLAPHHHEQLLEMLGLPREDIAQIRAWSRAG